MNIEHEYLELLDYILATGEDRPDRTGTGTISLFGYQLHHNFSEGFPLLTTKKVHFKSIAHELIWFLSGSSNTQYLKDNGVTIWDEWEGEEGEVGPIYGHQWRFWGAESWFDHQKFRESDTMFERGTDQIAELIKGVKENPYSRRHVVTAWNPTEVDNMALPPCHILWQMYVHADGGLSCHLYQRSCDSFLGLPYNIASYALLTELIANECGLKPKSLTISLGDVHIYKNHVEQVKLQLSREPKPLPTLFIQTPGTRVLNCRYEDFEIRGYEPHPHIKGEVSV